MLRKSSTSKINSLCAKKMGLPEPSIKKSYGLINKIKSLN